MRLLLAEDEKSLSRALVKILEHGKYSVDAVYDGEEAPRTQQRTAHSQGSTRPSERHSRPRLAADAEGVCLGGHRLAARLRDRAY